MSAAAELSGEPADTGGHGAAAGRPRFWALALGSVGVVYGDIGTSPLYALREALTHAQAGGITRAEVLGVTSLLLGALIFIVTIKYVLFLMRADNRGEGGTLAHGPGAGCPRPEHPARLRSRGHRRRAVSSSDPGRVPRPGSPAPTYPLGAPEHGCYAPATSLKRARCHVGRPGTAGEDEPVDAALRLSGWIDRLNEAIGKSVYWLILVAVLVSAVNAVVRKAFDVSSNAWLELQWQLFGVVFMLGAAYTFLKNEHIRIDIVNAMFPKRLRDWVDLLGHLVFLMPFVILMIVDGWPFFTASWRIDEQSMNAGGLPQWPAKLLIPVGFFLLFLQGVSEIIKRVAVMRGLIPDPHGEEPVRSEVILAKEMAGLPTDRGA
jgi:TRAP-type mannitol/chloroaromatic compound transport system permease small subunit